MHKKKETNKNYHHLSTNKQKTSEKKCLNVSLLCKTKVSDDPFILTQVLSSSIVEQNEIMDITWDNFENTTNKQFISLALQTMHPTNLYSLIHALVAHYIIIGMPVRVRKLMVRRY